MNRLFAFSFVAMFLAGVSAAPVSAAVVGYWQFDDAAAGTTADSLASQANGLTGTAQASGSGAKPVHAADLPGPLVYDGLLGALLNAANTTSLKFDNPSIPGDPNSHNGGRVSVPDPGGAGSILKPRNFTAEVFYKADGHVNFPTLFGKNRADTGGASWLLDTSGNDTFRVRVDSQPLGLGSGNSGFNQSFSTSINLADGKWHHLALTYDDATRRAELYVDYVLRGSGTTINPIVYDDRPLVMGQGAGGRALDGWMDEVRVSGSVLAPDEFLRAGATLEWDGGDADGSNGAGGGSGTWDTDATANWYPGSGNSDVVWSSATLNNAVFGGTGGTVSVSGPVSARSLTFDSTGYTVQNGTLTLAGPWITANQDAAIASTLAGSAGLVKDGAGTLTLTGVLGYTGGTVVDDGTLRLARSGVGFPGAGATGQFASAHTVTVNSGATLQVNGNWVLGDGLQNKVVVNGGTLEFLNSDNYFGNIELTGGHVTTTGGDRPWRTGNWGSGQITVHASPNSSTIGGELAFVGTSAGPQTVFQVADGTATDDLVVSARIYDHPGFERQMRLVKEGPGKMVLSNDGNTFAGGVTINGGTLSITSLAGGNTASALGAAFGTAPMLVFDGGTLEYTGPTVGGINRAFTINAGGATLDIANAGTTVTWTDAGGAGPIIGTGSLTKAGPGTLALDGNNAYEGGTRIAAGTVALGHNNALGTGTVTLAGGTLRPNGTRTLANNIQAAAGTESNLLDNVGTGDLILTGNLSGSGTVTIDSTLSRSLWFQGDNSGFTGTLNFTNNNNGTNLRLGGTGTSQNNSDNGADFSGAAFVLSGNTTNNRGLSWNGAAGTAVSLGALSGTGRIGNVLTGNAANWHIGALNTETTFSGIIEGTNTALTKVGAGTQVLQGKNTYTGGTTVREGTLVLQAPDANWNTSVFGGNATIHNGATLQIDTGYNTSSNDIINVLGGGTLHYSATYTASGGNTTYLRTINLDSSNGQPAVVTGVGAMRMGYNANGLITSTGSAANTFAAGLQLVNGGGRTVTLQTAAGNTLDFSGVISDYAGLGGTPLLKTGDGTLMLTGANTYVGPTTVSGGTLRIGNNTTTGSVSGSSAVNVPGGARVEWYRSDTSQVTIANAISGAGTVAFRGAGTTNTASQYQLTGNNSAFTGTWALEGGRMLATAPQHLGGGTVDVRANGQLLLSGAFTAPNHIVVSDSSGWRDNGFRLGAIRLEGNSSLSGNIALNQTTGVALGDNSGFGAVVSGYSEGNHVLSGVLSGSGEFSMSRYTSWNGGSTQLVNIFLQGSEPNTYTGKTVVDGQGARASLWLAKGTGFLGGFAQTAGSPVAIPSGATITGVSGYLGGGSIGSGTQKQAIQADTFGGTFTDGAEGWLGLWDGTYTKAVKVRLDIAGTTLTVTPLMAKYSSSNSISSLSNFETGGNPSGLATSDTAGGYGVFSLKFAGALSSAYAIPANTVVQMGSATGGQANLRMGLDDQFGPGVVMDFVNASGQWMRFELEGTSQTLAGINAGSTATLAGAVIQNQNVHHTVPAGDGTLTLNGSGDYLYHGYLRDQDNGGTARKLHLVKTGSGTQTLVGGNITHAGTTAVEQGQLVLFNTPNYRSPTTVATGATLTWAGSGDIQNNNTTATIALSDGATLENRNPDHWTVINGAVTVDGTATINHVVNATGSAGRGFFLDRGLHGSGVVTINAPNAGSGVNFRNNNSTFQGTLIVNGIASTTPFAGSGIGVGGCTTALTNADITLNGTMELLNQGMGWANGAPGDFWMGALSGPGVMVANYIAGGETRVRIGNTGNDGDFSGTIADGTGNRLVLTKNGSGTQVFSGANTYSGGTTVHAGTLLVNNTTGSGTGSGAVAVNNTATLGGTGSIAGTVTINAGGTHAPGASVGSQPVGGETWESGGRFEFEINDALGQPGGPIGWDELLVGGTLDLTDLTAQDPFHIDIVSLSGIAPGNIDNFVATEPVEWPFLRYETLAGDFSPDLFSLDSSQFSNPTGQGYFEILQMEYEGADWLAIGYVPEPGAWLLLVSAVACGLLVRRRK